MMVEHVTLPRHGRRGCRALVLAVAGSCVLASPSGAATAKLQVPDGNVLRSSSVAQVGFHLGRGWQLVHGQLENTPSVGSYSSTRNLGDGASCIQEIDVVGVTLKHAQRPRFRRGTLHVTAPMWWQLVNFRVTSHEQTGLAGWYAGRGVGLSEDFGNGHRYASPSRIGVVVLPTPSWLKSPSRPCADRQQHRALVRPHQPGLQAAGPDASPVESLRNLHTSARIDRAAGVTPDRPR